MLVSRRRSPPYEELFVGYGKNRASFHYEMAARQMPMRVLPDAFVMHINNSHGPARTKLFWWTGDTCWPEFRQRVRSQHRGFWINSAAQNRMDTNPMLVRRRKCGCIARVERLCVSSCRPATVEMRLRSSKLEVTPKAASGTPVGPRKGEQAKC